MTYKLSYTNKKWLFIITVLIALFSIIFIIVSLGENKCNCDIINLDIEEKEIGTWRYNGSIENFSRRLHNNMWGLTEEEKIAKTAKSYIYYKYNGNFGWEWERANPQLSNYTPSSDIHITTIYPEVIVGMSGPYSSTSEYFPIKLKDINSLTAEVEYNYTKTPTGEYNLAYDLWFVDNKGYNKAEVMIWIYGNFSEGDYQRTVADGIYEYQYMYIPPRPRFDWDYHAFILKDQNLAPSYHTANIKNLFNILIKSKKLNPEWNLLGIEFGNEISSGTGRIEISKYIVNINGNNA